MIIIYIHTELFIEVLIRLGAMNFFKLPILVDFMKIYQKIKLKNS